jgi:hypothetical protein
VESAVNKQLCLPKIHLGPAHEALKRKKMLPWSDCELDIYKKLILTCLETSNKIAGFQQLFVKP